MLLNWYEIILNLSMLLYLIGFALKDVYWLRVIVICAATTELIARYFFSSGQSVWIDIIWCLFYMIVNCYQFFMLYQERRGIHFTDEEKHLHRMVFSSIPLLQYRRLLNIAEWKTIGENERVVTQDKEVESLIVVYEGLLKVEVGDKIVSYLRNGNFIGEMSFLSGNKATANVSTIIASRVLTWNKAKLRELMSRDEELQMAMHSVFSGDLVNKLTRLTAEANKPPAK
ncbi:MAG: cyclic nucleotide-binding domain-containing protein [Candidatus Kapabacteria bacterium]|nr:cyclic nucleotide-binding domain-containing protein [Candidatus Kapabacteria bacterium]